MIFSEWLLEQMQKRDLSQAEMARKIGLTRQAVNHLLSGESKEPSIVTLQKIADVLDIPLGEVLRVAYDLPLEATVDTEWGTKMSRRLEKFPQEYRDIVEALAKTLETLQHKNNNNKTGINKKT